MTGRILVTGAPGFLGSHLIPILQARYGRDAVVGVSRADYDLMQREAVEAMLDKIRPEVVVHLAAYSGGIGANRRFPADFFFQNLQLTTLMFQAAAERGVERLIYTMGGCSYPALARSPIDEEQMWEGLPQAESIGYSMAKKMGIIAGQVYRAQHGLKSVILVPGNMYGEYDNYRTGHSHVIPATIRKFVEAARSGAAEVGMWGSGRPVRDFVYAGDVAALIPWFIENDATVGPVNLSTSTTTSIAEVAELIRDVVGYQGRIVWDASQPDGQVVKIFGSTLLQSLGHSCPTPLRAGIERTVAWFRENYDRPGAIRL